MPKCKTSVQHTTLLSLLQLETYTSFVLSLFTGDVNITHPPLESSMRQSQLSQS